MSDHSETGTMSDEERRRVTEERQAERQAALDLAAQQEAETIESTAIEEATPGDEALVPRDDEGDVYRAMSLADEQQIMAELQGRGLDDYLYSFTQNNRLLVGFSWKGIREAVRTLNARGHCRIRISPNIPPVFEEIKDAEGHDAVQVAVYAEDERHGGGNWGTGVQPLQMKLTGGNSKPDPFARHKALSKAQRNAMEALVPAEAIEAVKAQYLGAGHVKKIPGAIQPEQTRPELPPALVDEKAQEQLSRARGVYRELCEINPVALVPAAFNRMVTLAQHDHGRLDDLIAALTGMRDGELELAKLRERLQRAKPPELDRLLAEVQKERSQADQRDKLLELVEQHEKE
jgi:hypothetical protein